MVPEMSPDFWPRPIFTSTANKAPYFRVALFTYCRLIQPLKGLCERRHCFNAQDTI